MVGWQPGRCSREEETGTTDPTAPQAGQEGRRRRWRASSAAEVPPTERAMPMVANMGRSFASDDGLPPTVGGGWQRPPRMQR